MNPTILVIDDSPEIHPLVKAILSGESAELHSATDAKYGIVLADSICPDLILLDVDMPGTNGFEACRQLKANPSTAACPIIFLTGQTSSKEKVKGFGLGAVDYVTKPFIPAELLVRVRSSLRTHLAMRSLEEKVLVDPLTGMWNRSMFDRRINSEIGLRARNSSPLSVLMLDLDKFKQINDLHGHLAGDHILKSVGRIITRLCRGEDVACRFGGEEFVIIAPNTTADEAGVLAERIRKTVADTTFTQATAATSILGGEEIKITISIGIADASDAHDRTMLQRADDALYNAKHHGRNRVSTATAPGQIKSLAA